MSAICRIGSTIVVTYRSEQKWRYVTMSPHRKFWGRYFASHSRALVEGLLTGFELERNR